MAFVYHENRKIGIWEPVNVIEHNNNFYHVYVRDTWVCKECNYINKGIIIMPKAEDDLVFLEMKYLKSFEVPDLFKKTPCKGCGKVLQNHLLIIY